MRLCRRSGDRGGTRFHLRIGAEYDVGLKIAHDLGNCPDKLASVVKSADRKTEESEHRSRRGCGRCLCLGLPYWDKLLGRNGSGAVSAVYAA